MTTIKSREDNMASLEETGVPTATGVLHPAMAHRWLIHAGHSDLITKQAIRCHVEMKSCAITLVIEHPIGASHEMFQEIRRLSSGTFGFRLELLDGNHSVLDEIRGFGELVSHDFVLDYAKHEPLHHTLVIKFTQSA